MFLEFEVRIQNGGIYYYGAIKMFVGIVNLSAKIVLMKYFSLKHCWQLQISYLLKILWSLGFI